MAARFSVPTVAAVQKCIDKAMKDGCYIPAWEEIEKVLVSNSLAWTACIQPHFVGVSTQNRSKMGLEPSRVHVHGADILAAGWSFKKASDAVCLEIPSGEAGAKQLAYNRTLVETSDGLLPHSEHLKYVSIGGSHTNYFLRAVNAGCKTISSDLDADGDGFLNKDKLILNNPLFTQALNEGMPWTVIAADAPMHWPLLVTVVTKALNVEARTGVGCSLYITKHMLRTRNSGPSAAPMHARMPAHGPRAPGPRAPVRAGPRAPRALQAPCAELGPGHRHRRWRGSCVITRGSRDHADHP